MKKGNIQEAFLAAEFLGGGKHRPWDGAMSWEQPQWLLLGQPGLIGCQQSSTAKLHSLPGAGGCSRGSCPPGFGFVAVNDLRDSGCPLGWGGDTCERPSLCFGSALLLGGVWNKNVNGE